MDNCHSEPRFIHRAGTLNSLKEQLYSLNMRLLLAIQNHDADMQRELEAQMAAVQDAIERMSLGSGFRRSSKG